MERGSVRVPAEGARVESLVVGEQMGRDRRGLWMLGEGRRLKDTT